MKFSIRYADKIVGTFFVLALIILVAVVFMLGRSQRWFARDYQYKTYFYSASGLSVNMPVQYKGFTVGNVKKIRLTENENVEVFFSIYEEHFHRVRIGSMVEMQASPIGLGNSFIFHPGRGMDLLQEGALIPEINSAEAKLLVEAGFAIAVDSTDGINNIINQVNSILEIVNISLSGPDGAEPALGQIIKNVNSITEMIAVQLNPILGNLDSVTERLSDPTGSVMSFLDSEGNIYSELSSSLDSVSGILLNLERTSDFLPSNFPSLMADLNAALRSLQDVLVAVSNNPLLRRGVPEHRETSPGGSSSRNLDF
jgi:phospholipid/cholesterol/gamma-HCH transport system substrate-binding protein